MEKTDEELIDNFMGFKWVEVGYFGDPETETEWQRNNSEWTDSVGMESIGDYSVNVPANLWRELEDVDYHSWEQLMPVVEKIEQVISEPGASKMPGWDHWNNQFDGDINTDIGVAYKVVVEFIKWYNSQK